MSGTTLLLLCWNSEEEEDEDEEEEAQTGSRQNIYHGEKTPCPLGVQQ